MHDSEEKPDNVIEFAFPEHAIEEQLENWLARIVQSNDELVLALKRIRSSYSKVRTGRPADFDEVLVQVDQALRNAAKASSVV